ncbi:MAG TPA: cell division protein SepF [Armatimonadota bacterium]|jgi:cell division inhibitor SepF
MERNDLVQDDEDIYERRGWWDKVKNLVHGDDEFEEEDEMDGSAPQARPAARPASYPRMEAQRSNAIFVRRTIRTIDDAQAVADRLKERRPVVVNFEHTDEEIARSGLDFISGVVYALDGFYEKIGEKVFLFTPTNTPIAVDDPEATERAGYYPGSR